MITHAKCSSYKIKWRKLWTFGYWLTQWWCFLGICASSHILVKQFLWGSCVASKSSHNPSLFLYPHPFAVWLYSFSHQEVKSIFSLLEFELALWLALRNRMQWNWYCVSSKARPYEALCDSICSLGTLSIAMRNSVGCSVGGWKITGSRD